MLMCCCQTVLVFCPGTRTVAHHRKLSVHPLENENIVTRHERQYSMLVLQGVSTGDDEDIHRVKAFHSRIHAAAYLTALAKKDCRPWAAVDALQSLGSTVRALRKEGDDTTGAVSRCLNGPPPPAYHSHENSMLVVVCAALSRRLCD
jgi:hypothetical protein